MKKIFKAPVVWSLLLAIIICVILFFLGFRITYNPRLENSWDAVAACASWAGAIASAVAIIVAIRVPKVIAEQQNKIALFEKRNDVYSRLSVMFYDRPLMRTAFINERNRRDNESLTFGNYDSYSKQKSDRATLAEASFLFSHSISEKIDDLIKLRSEFYKLEDLIEEGIVHLSDADFDIMFTEYADMLISEVANSEVLKQVADRNIFIKSGEPLGKDGIPVVHNLYDIGKEQDVIARNANALQDEIMADITEEMRIYKVDQL